MTYEEIPSDETVVDTLRQLGAKQTAVALCDALVDAGYPRRDSQLAIQRAAERGYIEIGRDWLLSAVAVTEAA
ncbi:unnamed protein product [Ectocarpus sp. 12 AP-2014]